MQALGFPGGGAAAGIAPLKGIPLFNPMGVSGFNPSTFGFASGGIMTQRGPLSLKRYAMGGIAKSPQFAVFGEGSQAEAFVPLPDGRSIPVRMTGAGGGSINVSVNVDAGGSQVQGDGPNANQLGRVIGAAVQAEIVKQQRPGGLLSGTR
jgi:hypothetical protein